MQRILIVEDDKKLRKELETFLTKHGFIAKGLEKFDNTIQAILNLLELLYFPLLLQNQYYFPTIYLYFL